jgi:succinoglycan biosynthesis transport protein ExoP
MPRTDSETPKQTHLLEYLRVLSKRRWTILGTLVLAVGTGTFLSAVTVPQFEARAQLVIEFERPPVILFDKTTEHDETIDYQETQVKILQSRTLAARTLESLKLWQHPEFGGETAPEEASEITAFATGVRKWFAALPSHFSKTPSYTGKPIVEPNTLNVDTIFDRQESEAQSRAIDRFIGRLKASQFGGSHFVDVRFRSADPRIGAAVVNALTAEYILQNQEFKRKVSVESADWLGKQLEELRKQLRDSQTALQNYRARTAASGLIDPQEMQRKLEQASSALAQAHTARVQKEAVAEPLEAARGDPAALMRLAGVATDPTIGALRKELANLRQQDMELAQTLGERHPGRMKVQLAIQAAEARLNDETARAVELIRKDYLAARTEESRLVTVVDSLRREEAEVGARQVESDGLVRAATTDQKIFETLLERAKEASVTTKMVASNIRVVDAASVPVTPISPNRPLDLLVSLFLGSTFAVSIAFFFEYMDKTIKSPDEIKNELGLTCLGIVPVVSRAPKTLNVSNSVPTAFVEAFRTVRTNVLLSSADETVRSILVTSTGPNEGKTVVAANLAILLAQIGQSVVLVDADLRRPSVHEILGHSQEPGLSDLAAGRMKPSRVIHASSVPGLWCVPSGPIPPNPAEILSSDSFKRFIKVLERTFDWVIIDSAPVMAVTDATLVARITAGVLFVVAAEQSTRPAALKAIEQLELAQSRFVGAVLNKVKLQRNAFYYSDYYRREYGRCYASLDGAQNGRKAGRRLRWPGIFGGEAPLTISSPPSTETTPPSASAWSMASRRLRRLRHGSIPRA